MIITHSSSSKPLKEKGNAGRRFSIHFHMSPVVTQAGAAIVGAASVIYSPSHGSDALSPSLPPPPASWTQNFGYSLSKLSYNAGEAYRSVSFTRLTSTVPLLFLNSFLSPGTDQIRVCCGGGICSRPPLRRHHGECHDGGYLQTTKLDHCDCDPSVPSSPQVVAAQGFAALQFILEEKFLGTFRMQVGEE